MGGWTWYDYMSTPADVIEEGWKMIADEQDRYKAQKAELDAQRMRTRNKIR